MPMSPLTGKVAIVTGASKGIGAGIAKGLGAGGAAVVVHYSSSKTGADRVVAAITGTGGTAVAVQGDVSKVADVRRLFAETTLAFRSLDVLVNNAGGFVNLSRLIPSQGKRVRYPGPTYPLVLRFRISVLVLGLALLLKWEAG
jgi:NAD(P)-dependent dehydrogenase (short-subunit alcohol dehydrogenase family)